MVRPAQYAIEAGIPTSDMRIMVRRFGFKVGNAYERDVLDWVACAYWLKMHFVGTRAGGRKPRRDATTHPRGDHGRKAA